MAWQDWVVSIGNWVLILALIPTIKGSSKPALLTSLTTGFILLLFAVSFFTLGLGLSAVSVTLGACSWFFLAYQKYQQTKGR